MKCINEMFALSVLIPLIGYKEIPKTIESIVDQKYENIEILILRNSVLNLPDGCEVVERRKFDKNVSITVRELLIREPGKGNALNEGIQRANGELIAVVDADCVLRKGALWTAVQHFNEEKVVAVGGRLLVLNEEESVVEQIQHYEYVKTFQIARRFFALINAQCLISGAFGVFRKNALIDIGGYDTNTVGEDMELVLRLQDDGLFRTENRIVYEPQAICLTEVPHSLNRLLHQRDRWQRGLLDCLLKHSNMIMNPFYGCLGLVTLPYQILFGLLGPILHYVYLGWLLCRGDFIWSLYSGVVYLVVQFVISTFATYLDLCGRFNEWLKVIPKLVLITIFYIFYQLIISLGRIYAMITFLNRRLVW